MTYTVAQIQSFLDPSAPTSKQKSLASMIAEKGFQSYMEEEYEKRLYQRARQNVLQSYGGESGLKEKLSGMEEKEKPDFLAEIAAKVQTEMERLREQDLQLKEMEKMKKMQGKEEKRL